MNEAARTAALEEQPRKKQKNKDIEETGEASTSAKPIFTDNKEKKNKTTPKMDPPAIVKNSGHYSIVEDLIHTKASISFGQLLANPQLHKDLRKSLIPKKKNNKSFKRPKQSSLATTRDTTPLTCEAKVAGYKFKLILDSGSSVSVISKHFLEAIARKIDEPSRRDLSNVHGQRKRALGIAKEVPVTVNGVTIAADMEVMDTDAYAIIIGNGWLKEAKALIDYETCQMTI